MYYIGTLQQCQEYLDFVNKGQNFDGTSTRTWATIIPHHTDETKFAIIRCDEFLSPDEGSFIQVNSLPLDWFPADDDDDIIL